MFQRINQLQLATLSDHEFGVGDRQKADRLLGEIGGGDFGGASKQKVACEDGDGVVPVDIGGWGPPTSIRLVDHIVVIQASDVDQLDRHPGFDRASSLRFRAELGRQQGQQRPEALSPRHQQVLKDLCQVGIIGVGHLEQARLNRGEPVPDVWEGNQGIQFLHPQSVLIWRTLNSGGVIFADGSELVTRCCDTLPI